MSADSQLFSHRKQFFPWRGIKWCESTREKIKLHSSTVGSQSIYWKVILYFEQHGAGRAGTLATSDPKTCFFCLFCTQKRQKRHILSHRSAAPVARCSPYNRYDSLDCTMTSLNPMCAGNVFDFMRTDSAAENWRGKCRRRPQQVVSPIYWSIFQSLN